MLMGPWEQIWVKLESKYKRVILQNELELSSAIWSPFCVSPNVLINVFLEALLFTVSVMEQAPQSTRV